jgi:hypothetical protein
MIYVLSFNLLALDKNMYHYLESIKTQEMTEDSYQLTEHAPVHTNIENGLGIFTAYTKQDTVLSFFSRTRSLDEKHYASFEVNKYKKESYQAMLQQENGEIFISVPDQELVIFLNMGSYNDIKALQAGTSFKNLKASYSIVYRSTDCNLTITGNENNVLSGTFSFTDKYSFDSHVIENGYFEITYYE